MTRANLVLSEGFTRRRALHVRLSCFSLGRCCCQWCKLTWGQRVAFDCNFELNRPSFAVHAIPRLLWFNMKAYGRCGLVRLHWSIGWGCSIVPAKLDQHYNLCVKGAFGGHFFSETEINFQNRLWNESLLAWWVNALPLTRRFLATHHLFPLGISFAPCRT